MYLLAIAFQSPKLTATVALARGLSPASGPKRVLAARKAGLLPTPNPVNPLEPDPAAKLVGVITAPPSDDVAAAIERERAAEPRQALLARTVPVQRGRGVAAAPGSRESRLYVMNVKDDFSEFGRIERITTWWEHVPDDADTESLLHELTGHAVGLRDHLYYEEKPEDIQTFIDEAQDRSLILVDVLNALRGGPIPRPFDATS
jgi:hypothetical protein